MAIAGLVGLVAVTDVHAHTRITTDVTWGGEIRDLLQKHCMSCHHPGGLAPDYVDLTVYGTDTKPGARAWAVAIEEEILTGKMPPWQADPRFSSFSNEKVLNQEEIDTIIAWIRGGAPQGPRRNLPVPDGVMEVSWIFGTPDAVIEPEQDLVLAADEEYAVHTFRGTPELDADRYITAFEFLSANSKNIKSMTAWVHDPEGQVPAPIEVEVQLPYDPLADEDALEQTRMRPMPTGPHFLGRWMRSDGPVLLPDLAGRLLRAGSTIEVTIEYERPEFADWSAEVRDRSQLGIFFAAEDEEIDLLVESRPMPTEDFVIRANDANAEVVARMEFGENVHLVSLNPAMGRLGKNLEARIIYPDGMENVLLWLPDFDHRWNGGYVFSEPVSAPAGSTLVLTGHYDNTGDNWDNPNSPPRGVQSGIGRFDEQLYAMVDYMLDDHLYVQEVYVPDPEEGAEDDGGGMSFAPNVINIGTAETEDPFTLASTQPGLLEEAGLEIYWCPMRGNPCELKDFHAPGECPECWMALRPRQSFFEGKDLAPDSDEWVTTKRGRTNAWWCPNRAREDHELKEYGAPGECEVDGEPLLHISRFKTVHTFTCLTVTCERFKDIYYGPGLCPGCGQPVVGMGHMDHNPLHGGWQFFMADNMYHHLEGTMPEPGIFKLYFYDDWKTPLDARNFKGSLYVEREDPETGEFHDDEFALKVAREGDTFLTAELSTEFPLVFFTQIWLAGERKRFDFEFDELTAEPEAGTQGISIRLHTHERGVLVIPDDTTRIVSMVLQSNARLAQLIGEEDWFALHNPAFDVKDLVAALDKRTHDNLNVRQKGELKQTIGLINRGANGLDRAGDAADGARVRRAYISFDHGVETLRNLFPEATE